MVGLGRMGANMVRRLLGDQHPCVVHDLDPQARRALEQAGATGVASLAPRFDAVARAAGRGGATSGAERGFLHCGPNRAGHVVKMIHDGIEYGLMAAYAEGFNLLRGPGEAAGEGAATGAAKAAADAEAAPPAHPQAPRYAFDLAEIADLWRRGSVVRSWLLDLTADDFADRVLSAMRREFGGHLERSTAPKESCSWTRPDRMRWSCSARTPSSSRCGTATTWRPSKDTMAEAFGAEGRVEAMELAHLPCRKGRSYEDHVGERGLERLGTKRWRKAVLDVVETLRAALRPDYVVLGEGNARRLDAQALPPQVRWRSGSRPIRSATCR